MPPTPSRTAFLFSAIAATATMAKSPCRRATSRKATPAPFADRKTHRHDQFIAGARGGQHVFVKFLCREHALTAFGFEHNLTAEQRQRQRQLRARIGMGDRAAHRAFVAGLEMPDMR